MHTHAHTYTLIHAGIHAHTHTRAHTLILPFPPAHTHARVHMLTCSHVQDTSKKSKKQGQEGSGLLVSLDENRAGVAKSGAAMAAQWFSQELFDDPNLAGEGAPVHVYVPSASVCACLFACLCVSLSVHKQAWVYLHVSGPRLVRVCTT